MNIVKQENDAQIFRSMFSQPKGVLTLTWDQLSFVGQSFGGEKFDYHIPVCEIQSTSIEKKGSYGYVLKVQTAGNELQLYWKNDRSLKQGIGAFNGGFAGGMMMDRNMNQNVVTWAQLIDDLRFGRLKNPSNQSEKKCPMCAEMVKAEATICRFCHYNFETKEVPRS